MSKRVELVDGAQEIYERLKVLADEEARRMANLLASAPPGQLFGRTEFELRDQVHEFGAKALEVAADERQKKGRGRTS